MPVDSTEDDVVTFCRDLVRIDTSNPGAVERPAAEYVAQRLAEMDLDPVMLESAPGRANVVVRLPGRDRTREALLIHGHLDVVPPGKEQWRFPPFSGEVVEGCVFGRGSVDMKGPVAMVLATVAKRLAESRPPSRDVVLAFVADEERGSRHGSQFLVEKHPELFAGCSEGIGEVGGFSTRIAGRRAYLLQTAERGVAWTRLEARGTSSHGSLQTTANPVAALARTLEAIVSAPTPQRMTETNRALLAALARLVGEQPAASDSSDGGDGGGAERLLDHLGPVRRIVSSGLRNTLNPTMLEAGSSPNVVPAEATAVVDGRFLAGHEAALDELLGECCAPGVRVAELLRSAAVESPPGGVLFEAMTGALLAEDPDAVVLPFTWPGFTDAKQFARLGISCYGFLPLRLPDDYDFPAMFHGLDERVPVESLHFGVRVLDHLLDSA